MIHLHLHDAKGSLLDSTIRPDEPAKRAKELGMEAVGLSNHGYMSSVVEFYKACKREGVKPILGCELYVCDDMTVKDKDSRYDHLLVIAKNQTGYVNLQRVVTLGFTEGFYYKPRVDMKTLRKYAEGLVVTTACIGGEIPKMIRNDVPLDKVADKINLYNSWFENFYLEVQPADNPEQKKVNQALVKLSKMTGVPLVATSDVHFLYKDDFELHNVFIQINQNRDNEVYKDCWFKTEDEVMEVLVEHIGFDNAVAAVAETHNIAAMCNVELDLGKSYLPHYPVPKRYKDENEYLKKLINDGFIERGLHQLPADEKAVYIDRLREEYEVISKKNFAGYFLIVSDILRDCRSKGIMHGDGRGSAGGSLVCYVLGITNVDPIRYNLSFGRFLTLERTELPDIDLDLQSSQKQNVVNMLKDKYGHDLVAQIATFQGLQGRAIMDSVGKVLGYSYAEIGSIKRHIPDNTTLSDALKSSGVLREMQKEHPKLFEYALRLEGLPRSISVHAGGVVVCPSNRDFNEFSALALSKDQEEITHLDMHDIEAVGLVKLDVLATVTLDVIADTLRLIGRGHDYLDVSKMDFNDEKTWRLIQEGKTDGVFQLESTGMKDACIRVAPNKMDELIAILALYRPDTMGELDRYINRKNGVEPITYIHPDMEQFLHYTYGTMIYQEQLMQIVKHYGGFSDGEADRFRKGIGKKDPKLVRELSEEFKSRCIERGYSEEIAEAITKELRDKGGYMFNASHSAAYALISYKTAFLKANHTAEFMCSLLSNQRKPGGGAIDYESISLYAVKARELGVPVKHPDINLSSDEFSVVDGEILFGLGLIKGVGKSAVLQIEQLRPFTSFEDFLERADKINKTATVSLIKAGAFDWTGRSRKDLLMQYGLGRFKPVSNVNKRHIEQMLAEGIVNEKEAVDRALCLERWNKWSQLKHLKEWEDKEMAGDESTWEFESLSCHLSGDPFEGVDLPDWDSVNEGEVTTIGGTVIAVKKTKIKRGKQAGREMAFVSITTSRGVREITFFSDEWSRHQDKLDKGSQVVIKGIKQGEQMLGSGVMKLKQWKEKFGKHA